RAADAGDRRGWPQGNGAGRGRRAIGARKPVRGRGVNPAARPSTPSSRSHARPVTLDASCSGWTGSMARVLLLVFGGLMFLLSVPGAAQEPVPRFRSGVDLVDVDVSVLDDNRLPVRGLTVD